MAGISQSPGRPVQAKKPVHAARSVRKVKKRNETAEVGNPVAAQTTPRAYFLIGENKKIAGDVAEHEWGWTRTKAGWIGPVAKAEIKFLADIHAVAKEAAKGPIAVYEGYRWYAAIAPHTLDALVKAGSVVKIAAPQAI